MSRLIVIFTLAWFIVLGTGAAEYAHNAQHAQEDARRAQDSHHGQHTHDADAGHPRPERPAPVHDDSNCFVHAQLHQPLIVTPTVLVLIDAGLLVAFVSELAPTPDSLRIPSRIDCRGPPALV